MTPPPSTRPLASVEWLAAHLRAPDVRVADVRWYLAGPRTGTAEYAAGHVPGAVFLDIDRDLSGLGAGVRAPGRHPLPPPAHFANAMEAAGIGDDTWVVAYDDAGGACAARVWFLLRYFGHDRGLVLDGGLAAWRAAGQPLATEPATPRAARFHPLPRTELVVDRLTVDRLRRDPTALLLDARTPDRYRGEVEPIDKAPGHIPGALNAPYPDNLDSTGRFLPPDAIAARYRALGVAPDRQVVCYCGSGVTACHDLLALERAGLPGARLYEGSYSDWAGSDMPIERAPAG